jgi:hypothetical protein
MLHGVLSSIEAPGFRSRNRLDQPYATGSRLGNGVREMILFLKPGASVILRTR